MGECVTYQGGRPIAGRLPLTGGGCPTEPLNRREGQSQRLLAGRAAVPVHVVFSQPGLLQRPHFCGMRC